MSAAPAFAPSIDSAFDALPAPAHPATRPTPVDPAPSRASRAARPRVRYAVVAVVGIFGILLAQLLLSMVVSEGAYQIQALQSQNKELGRDVQELTEAQQRLSSTQNLVANAAALGMVNDPNRVFLRLSDGAVLGTPVAASAEHSAVTGSDLVSNKLVEGLPLAVAETGKVQAGDPAVAGVPETAAGAGTLASTEEGTPANGGLPSPVTH
jgi:hypothetical protein